MKWRQNLVETIAEQDEELLEMFFDGKELPIDRMKEALRKATIAGTVLPMLCGSAFKNKGVQPLLDAIVEYLPSPLEAKPIIGNDPKTDAEITRKPDDKEPFAALAFKIATDPYGNLTYFRVYSGTLEKGSYVYNARSGSKERIGRILRMHANHREDIDSIGAGDIAAAVGLTDTRTGDTLCDEKHPIMLEIDHVPGAGHLAGDRAEDQGRSGSARQGPRAPRARRSDVPHAHRRRDAADDHRRHGRAASRDHPRPSAARVQSRSERRQTAGRVQRSDHQDGRKGRQVHPAVRRQGSVRRRLAARRAGEAGQRVSRSIGRSSAARFRRNTQKAVQEGIEEASQSGVLAGYPVLDFKVDAFDGSYHDVDSSEMAFKIAASMGFKEANRAAGPILLEPIMKVEVTTPKDYMGAITGDLNRRRGMIQATEEAPGGAQVINAHVPLSEMFGYATDMRSATQGRATYTMEFSHYEKAPKSVEEEIVAKAAGKKTSAA